MVSGSLSFEALSRGARVATLLENAGTAAHILKDNLKLLNVNNANVIHTDSLNWLQQPASEPFDIIFLDPPFHQDMLETACQLLDKNGYLSDHSLIYVEVEKELSPLPVPEHWQCLKNKTAGQVSFNLFQYTSSTNT